MAQPIMRRRSVNLAALEYGYGPALDRKRVSAMLPSRNLGFERFYSRNDQDLPAEEVAREIRNELLEDEDKQEEEEETLEKILMMAVPMQQRRNLLNKYKVGSI